MLTPEELLTLVETMHPLLDELNEWITIDLIKRLLARLERGEAYLTATDEWQMEVYQAAGGHLEAVQREIARWTTLADKEIQHIFEDAGIKALARDNAFYKARGLNEMKLTQSESMLRLLEDSYQRTTGTVHNFTRTTATSSQQRFIRLLDKAHFLVNSGAASYTRAVEEVTKELVSEQTKVYYPSGHADTIETAVLRAVRTGTAQAAGNMAIEGMIERDWDIILVSAHLGARYGDGGENPGNHFWWQGKFYSRTGRTPGLLLFEKATGYGTGEGLCGWNCRHSFGPGDRDFNPYQDFDSEENRKAYDLSQKQRTMEARIRRTKAKMVAQREAGMEQEYNKTARLLEKQNLAYQEFCRENDLKPLMERIQIAQWTREDAKRSILAANGGETVAKTADSGIIERTERNGGNHDVQFVGTIDKKIYSCVTDDITTDEVVITNTQIQHIKDRHPNDYERFAGYFDQIVQQPDYIIEANKPNTALILKEILEEGESFKTVLRLSTSADNPGYKNSIITFMKIDRREWERLLRNKKTLYKRE